MRRHPLSDTTHTLEMTQIAELNRRLADVHPPVTSGRLGLTTGVGGPEAEALSDSARLVGLVWDGSPEFPDIRGRFATGGDPGHVLLELHTATLRQLSRLLGIRQRWGIGRG